MGVAGVCEGCGTGTSGVQQGYAYKGCSSSSWREDGRLAAEMHQGCSRDALEV